MNAKTPRGEENRGSRVESGDSYQADFATLYPLPSTLDPRLGHSHGNGGPDVSSSPPAPSTPDSGPEVEASPPERSTVLPTPGVAGRPGRWLSPRAGRPLANWLLVPSVLDSS